VDGFFRKEWVNLISVVVVTKIQELRVSNDMRDELANATWERDDRSNDVLCCDSLLGLGGLQLRNCLSEGQDILKKVQDKNDPISEV